MEVHRTPNRDTIKAQERLIERRRELGLHESADRAEHRLEWERAFPVETRSAVFRAATLLRCSPAFVLHYLWMNPVIRVSVPTLRRVA